MENFEGCGMIVAGHSDSAGHERRRTSSWYKWRGVA